MLVNFLYYNIVLKTPKNTLKNPYFSAVNAGIYYNILTYGLINSFRKFPIDEAAAFMVRLEHGLWPLPATDFINTVDLEVVDDLL